MANDEHVKIVRGGKDEIDKWRRAHPGEKLDLSGANFSSWNLERADLSDANLSDALLSSKLAGAKLMRARLDRANLTAADLTKADLSGAELYRTNLSQTILQGTKLCETSLYNTNFHAVNLTETDFTGATFGRCTFAAVDLSRAKGLDSDATQHVDASSIGIDSIFLSRKKPPSAFFKRCGVRQDVLEFLASLAGDFYSCFISYKKSDERFAERLCKRLQQENVAVFFARQHMKGGHTLIDQISTEIDKLLLVLSAASIKSEWVKTELRRALSPEKEQKPPKLFPIRLCEEAKLERWQCVEPDGRDLAREVRAFFIPDFRRWKDEAEFEAAFARLLRDLRKDKQSRRRQSKRRAPGRALARGRQTRH
jgi:hypothetical protein